MPKMTPLKMIALKMTPLKMITLKIDYKICQVVSDSNRMEVLVSNYMVGHINLNFNKTSNMTLNKERVIYQCLIDGYFISVVIGFH